MGKLTQFSILISNPQAVYYAGQWLQGNVVLNLSEEMKMRGLHLHMVGAANVHWSERHSTGSGKNRRTTTRHYRANETYFNNKVILYGNAGGMFSDTTNHPAGNYSYPFQMQLPSNLPSSFEGAHGNVRYYIKCVIDRPWKFDHTTKRVFNVISMLDLNQVPNVLNSPQGQNSKTLCCLCCASGPIEASVRLDRTGFVPGEDIRINAEINNAASRSVSSTKAELRMVTRFHATSKSKSVTRVVAVKKAGEIEGGGHQTWTNEPLHIPPIPPSDLVGCRIIDINYYIRFVVDPSGPATDLEVSLPVTIGTIPLQSYFNAYSQAAAAAGMSNVTAGMSDAAAGMSDAAAGMSAAGGGFAPPPPPPTAPDYTAPAPGYGALGYSGPSPSAPLMPPGAPPNAPPPSYQQSVFGVVDTQEEGENEHLMGDKTWAPSYSYYNWNNANYSLPAEQPTD